MEKKKAFTLIELIAVLVILAILALIVTPLVMNIIKKARISADKRSIDAYGRSIELAIASYLLEEGKFPTSIDQLTIEYSGDEVICSTTQINSDSSVYLTGCTVNGREVDYSYGDDLDNKYKEYSFVRKVFYDDEEYYVIENSSENDSTVKLLKAKPLSFDTVNDIAQDLNFDYEITNEYGYGLVKFGLNNDYDNSDIKKILDSWKQSKSDIDNIIDVRLINKEDIESFGYQSEFYLDPSGNYMKYNKGESTPSWIYSFSYWINAFEDDSINKVYKVTTGSDILPIYVSENSLIRPIIEVNKKSNKIIDIDYKIGDEVTYNNVNYYVIQDSKISETTVTLLKAEPLTVAEVNEYGEGHVNRYTRHSVGTTYNQNGYGGMAYYSSETCGYVNSEYVKTGCTKDYAQSEVKNVIDSWKNSQASVAIEARLITYNELLENLGYEDHFYCYSNLCGYSGSYNNVPNFIYNSNYWYWTMSPCKESRFFSVWHVRQNGGISENAGVYEHEGVVRPVIVLPKSALSS